MPATEESSVAQGRSKTRTAYQFALDTTVFAVPGVQCEEKDKECWCRPLRGARWRRAAPRQERRTNRVRHHGVAQPIGDRDGWWLSRLYPAYR